MNNEITVKLKCSINEIKTILKDKGFKITNRYDVEDIYYIQKDIDMTKIPIRQILKNYILIRKIKQYEPNDFINNHNIIKITYKLKDIDKNGNITKQEKYDCEIINEIQGKNILEAMNYKEIMTIKERDIVYSKNELDLEIKEIENGENLIEIETKEKNKELDTINKLKQKISQLNIPIEENDFFVSKSEIELKKILGDFK